MTRYPIPAARLRVEETILRSRFVTTVEPVPTVDAARSFIAGIRAEFADATHNCYAFVAGPPGSTARAGMSDDGEPAGTAGRPMLAVLLGCGIGDIGVTVTRYYGGTKLGTGGLVRAYAGGVKLALAALPLAEHVERVAVTASGPYRFVTPLERLLADYEAELAAVRYETDVTWTIALPLEHASALIERLRELSNGEIVIQATEPA